MPIKQEKLIIDALSEMVYELNDQEICDLEDLIVNYGGSEENILRKFIKEFENKINSPRPYAPFRSRYGENRYLEKIDDYTFAVSGASPFWRIGMNHSDTAVDYFDPRGGPFIHVGDDYGFGKITKIKLSDSGKDDHFRILVEVEKSEK